MNLSKNLTDIAASQNSIFALIAMLILIFALMRFRKIKFTPHMITHVGLCIALATVLKMFKLFEAPFGGSVTLGSMVPIILVALVYGPEVGYFAGFVFGIITLILGPYILHPLQVLFDYPLCFMALGVAGHFKDRKLLGATVGIFLRFLCVWISGVAFWASNTPEGMSPYLYSFLYNISYLGIDGFICVIILTFLPMKQMSSIMLRHSAQH